MVLLVLLDKAVEDIQADKEDTCHSPWVEGMEHVAIGGGPPGPGGYACIGCMPMDRSFTEEEGTWLDTQDMHHEIYFLLLAEGRPPAAPSPSGVFSSPARPRFGPATSGT